MATRSKPGAIDLSQVRINPDAYTCLNNFLGALRQRILERAASQAQMRERESGPGNITIEDVVHSGQAVLPLALADLERSLKHESTNVRHAS
jgi:hypothetical protein